MRRYVRAPGARFAPESCGRMDRLRLLRRALTPEEYVSLRRLTGGMRHLPFGEDTDAMEHVLLSASDEDMELLAKCQSALVPTSEEDARPGSDVPEEAMLPLPSPPARAARLQFRFEEDSRELAAFLGSLRRNGFRAVSVDTGLEVTVFVDLVGQSDLEVVQAMALAQSLREIVRRTSVNGLRGHRVGR